MKRHFLNPLLAVAGVIAFSACSGSDVPSSSDDSDSSERTAEAKQAIVTDCDYLNPGIVPPLPTPVDFDSELVIRDLNVVEDPCRTTWAPTGPCAPGTVGVWTFGHLMAQMAGNVPVERFVGEWLDTFDNPQVVNTFPVNPRPGIRPLFIDPWLVASGCNAGDPIVGKSACKLDIQNAPFRLLAIVNRIDLAGPASYGGPSPGEGRFVFGFLDPNTGNPLAATVILEYQIHGPKMNTFDWATMWHDLSNFPLGSAPYNDHLQLITDNFTSPGFRAGGLNHQSSIETVRTNEIDFGAQWELREFQLEDVGAGPDDALLRNHTLAQTPDDSMNLTKHLDLYLVTDEPQILTFDHVVPAVTSWGQPLLGGASTAPFFWQNGGTAGPIAPDARHFFELASCNGCHTGATGTKFTHIDPRPAGAVAGLSGFLAVSPAWSGGANGLPASFLSVPDQDPTTGLVFDYNEPWRRVCEMTRLLNGDPNPYSKGNGAH